MAREITRDAGRRGNPVSASQRAGSDPRGARGIDRAWSPAGAVFLVAVSFDAPDLRLPAKRSLRGARTSGTRYQRRGLPAVPPRRGRVRRSLRVGPEAGRRGGISAPAGQSTARSHARHRDTPRTGSPPGAMAAESHRRGHRPNPRTRPVSHRTRPRRTPRDRSRGAVGRCGQEAQNRNIVKIGERWGASMRERAEELGGSFEAVDRPGGGTVVRARLPLTGPSGG